MNTKWRQTAGAARAHNMAGFSLLEMMIVLLIAGILLLVALPGYRGSVLKSSRAAAWGALVDVMARQEQYFINNKRYSLNLDGLGLPSPFYIDKQAEPVTEGRAVYRIELDIESDTYMGVKAVPENDQLEDRACMTFAISSIGVRSVSGTSSSSHPEHCW
jgi:type IV pilus assembly protein PilE